MSPPSPPTLPWPEPQANSLIVGARDLELERLVAKARDYMAAAFSDNTRAAYGSAWKQFEAFRIERGFPTGVAPSEEILGVYLVAMVERGLKTSSIAAETAAIRSISRDMGTALDGSHPAIRRVMQGIERKHGQPPQGKEPVLGEDLVKMLGTLDKDVRGLRDRAILLVGYCGALRRSEIIGLDVGPEQSEDGVGWVEAEGEGLVLHLNGKTGWREVAVGPGSSDETCPVAALKAWKRFGRIAAGPLFRRIRGKRTVTADRLNSYHVARLVKAAVAQSGVARDLAEFGRKPSFSAHSLRSGLATGAAAEEGVVQKQLGHASATMTRRYQRHRDRFHVNLTKAAGL